MRAAEDKQEVAEEKEATSKERFKREESALEKSAKAMVSTVKTATKKVVSPIGNIFQKLLAFLGILGKGIALNAAFEWFKDPENQKKITKFFNILQKNWKLIAKILGVIGGAILIGKIIAFIGAIKGLVAFIVGPLVAGLTKAAVGIAAAVGGSAVAGGALAVAGGVAAGAGLLFGAKAAFDLTKKKASGGQAHYDAFNQLIAELNEKGINVKGSGKGEKFYLTGTGRGAGDRHQKSASGGTEEQKALVEEYKKRRDAVISNRDAMRAEMDNQKDAVVPVMKTITGNQRGGKSGSREMIDNQATNKLRQEAEDKVRAKFESNIPGIMEARAMGGPVTAKTPYLVGEAGPEIFTPNVDGSVINNMRTEKIYQMLSTGKKGRTRIVELPPQTIEGPKPEIKMPRGPATKAPKISSSNSLDGYRSVSSGIYGIMV